MSVHLRIEDLGRDVPVREQTFQEGLITIGREPSNVLSLDDPAHTISRRHAAIRNGKVAELMDLGSRNATYLNERRLEPQEGYALRDGDIIQLGSFRIEVRVDEPREIDAGSPEAGRLGNGAFETRMISPSGVERYRRPSEDASREELARAVEELKLLNELAVEIGASHDPDAIMEEVVRRNLEVTGAEQGLITLIVDSEESEEVVHRTMIRTGQEFDLDKQLEAWMIQYRRPFLLNNPREHPIFRSVQWKHSLRNLLCVPLLVRGKMTGLLTLYNKRHKGGFTDSDLQLASIIAAQSAHIIENARLFEEQKELIRMQQEMQVALDIQTNLMPNETPSIDGYDVAGRSLAAQVVGGDHFDYIPMHDGRWVLCLGDVSGKGLPAALVMSNLQAMLRAQTLWSDSVKACLEGANRLLHESTNRRTFVTLFYSVLDPISHALRFANAGHNRPLVIGSNGVRPLSAAGFVLGAMRNVQYTEEELTLAPGQTLLIFSDGVVEARGEDGTLFDDDRLEQLAARFYGAPAQSLIDAVVDAVKVHAGKEPQADDITLLAVRRLP